MKVRLPHVLEWLSANEPDVLVLQEIKQLTEMFPQQELAEAGYRSLANGQKTYNGVAVVSREEARDPDLELPGLDDPQRRVLATTIAGVRVVNLLGPFRERAARGERLYFTDDTHWNSDGIDLAARVAWDEINELFQADGRAKE